LVRSISVSTRFRVFAIASAAFVFSSSAAEQIGVSAQFADFPAGADVPAGPEKVAKVKGANILSSPRIILAENVPGTIEVSQETPVPGGIQVSLGVTLSIKTSVTDRGSIWFSGNLRDRSRGGGEKSERLETVGFATREWYFSGYTEPGGTVVIRTAPATAQTTRDGKTVTSSRELVAYLKFDKIAPPPVKKPAPAAKTPARKPPSSSKTRKR
jgi:hypothetical protein